ncbi:SPFH domain-containing protein [Gordonia sp. (in: high G+C Gram-positive bacteria)]|jgi:regulator of protease activity HflC (stomatin/prohibitin superfamily)|uniref:SPFH domain-containing protein n=1 Tax=Gordonia sp. (in: high G+C Gram-positive bacteria) TaxID=84139 RepID=UPI001D91B69B|nr:SPFH domain-containing protein [Gordonia sp. (in: high G+C Gram-positive bacteria)]MCB1296146.1 SPFH domain-containing protein [Gordonia sp. (in: high G+C Gram-positive bacteria)]HMS75971.1 SPFH domain-containing protein [Gordonia sp. (in: high G+C Gram-positive bacteria)]
MNAESVPVGREGAQVEVSERPCWYAGTAAAIGVFVAVFVAIGLAAVCIVFAVIEALPVLVAPAVILVVAAGVGLSMVVILAPGHTYVVQLFGRYVGTVRQSGMGLVPPLTTHRRVSARVRNFETAELKVNDAVGNPVHVAAIIVWQVADTAKATFGVEDYEEFIGTQAESALRQVTTAHPYDDDASHGTTSLRGSTDQVAAELAEQVADRASLAGLEILETRISSLAYAPEIAQAMLQRQQASALLAAREKIVDGAVGLVQSALARLEAEGVVALDDERRAAMVSNLLVVLCGDSRATPVVNTGSLYS